jgi:hypothetical protein
MSDLPVGREQRSVLRRYIKTLWAAGWVEPHPYVTGYEPIRDTSNVIGVSIGRLTSQGPRRSMPKPLLFPI